MTTTTESAPAADTQATETTTEPVAATDGANKETAATTGPASPKKEPKPNVHKQDFEKDVVYLYQFPRSPTIPSVSAYCLKVETFLRVTGIKYENVDNRVKYKSKKGQLPFIELNGEEIADSDIIIRELSKKFEKDLNSGLTAEQRNQSHAFESMLNNHTAWVVRWWRYSHPDEFLAASQLDIKRSLNSKLPKPVLNLMFKWGFKRNMSAAVGHGIGHHSPEEAIDFGKGDLKALSDFLGSKDFFFGKEVRQLDVVAFAHVAQFVFVPFEGIKDWMETETPNLLAFCNRIKDKFWPDWEEMGKTLEINTHLPKKELTPEQLEEQKKAEEKKAEEERKKEEKRKEKVGASATDSADDQTQGQSGNKPSRSSTSFRLPAFVPLIRSRVSSSTPSASQEEKKKQKEEEKRKKQEEKERKKKEAEEAKAKAKAEAEAKAAEAKAASEAAKATGESAEKTEGADAKQAEATKDTEAKEETTEAEKKE